MPNSKDKQNKIDNVATYRLVAGISFMVFVLAIVAALFSFGGNRINELPRTGGKTIRAFVTNQSFDPNFSDLGGADNVCQSIADGASLGGDWVAWLSTDSKSAISKLTLDGSEDFTRIDQQVIANNVSDLLDGSLDLPLNIDQQGNLVSGTVGAYVWTGTSNNGLNRPNLNCVNWTSSSAGDSGGVGELTTSGWTEANSSSLSCIQQAKLYCFEKIATTVATSTPTSTVVNSPTVTPKTTATSAPVASPSVTPTSVIGLPSLTPTPTSGAKIPTPTPTVGAATPTITPTKKPPQGSPPLFITATPTPKPVYKADYGILGVGSGASVEITDLIFQNGNGKTGGAIMNEGTLNIMDSVVKNNTTVSTGTNIAGEGLGGGIYNSGVLNITRTMISDNTANSGGGIYNANGAVTITDSTIERNYLLNLGNNISYGAGIATTGSVLTVNSSTIDANGPSPAGSSEIVYGGGIYAASVSSSNLAGVNVNIINSTISGNTASNGGGIYAQNANFNVDFTTIAFNKLNSTIGNNASGIRYVSTTTVKFDVFGSIIAQNTGNSQCSSTGTPLTSSGYNVVGDLSCQINGNGDLEGSNPALQPLVNNGGYTKTHAILQSSVAFNHVLNCNGITKDQRSVTRPQSTACDSGAFELQITNTPTPSNTPTNTPTPSSTPTKTPTPSITPSGTILPSITPTITSTVVPSNTPSKTPTVTPSKTNTPLPTSTPTKTATPTPTKTIKPTATKTPVPPAATNTPKPAATNTPKPVSSIFVPSSTPILTTTATPTETLIPTDILIPSGSQIPNQTPSITPTPGFSINEFLKTPAGYITLCLCCLLLVLLILVIMMLARKNQDN